MGKFGSYSPEIDYAELLLCYKSAVEKAPKPAKMSNAQYLNYLAIQLLEEIGNDIPSQEDIDHAELLLKSKKLKKILFNAQ